MARYEKSRIIPIVLTLIIVIVAIVALVSMTRSLFFSRQTAPISDSNASQVALLSTTVDRSVRMIVRGKIVGNEDFRSYEITVTPSTRTFTVFAGYTGQQTERLTFGNNIPAYEEFVYALNRADLAKGEELSDDRNDTRGVCATGRLYSFAILNAGQSVETLWTTSCRGSEGSLEANEEQLASLFAAQIPNSRSLISKIDL